MPRTTDTLQIRALEYFIKENPNNDSCSKFICKVISDGSTNPCGKKLDGKKKSNLTSHIQSVHPNFFNHNIALTRFCPKEMARLRLKYIQDRSEIVAVNLRPYEILNDSGFRKLSEAEFQKLAAAGFAHGLADKHHEVYKKYIVFVASKIREKIIKEVKNNLLSAMVDISTKHNRSILGIQIQFVNNSIHTKRSLGMIELNETHSAKNLKRIIFERLAVFGIVENQIATITVDNGSNLIAMIKQMNDSYANSGPQAPQLENRAIEVIDSVSRMESFSDDEIQLMIMEAEAEATIEVEQEPVMIENVDDIYLNDPTEYDNLLAELGNEFILRTKFINGIRCAEHTLQLGIIDMLKKPCVNLLMSLAKAAAIKLRTSSHRNKLIEENIKFKIPHMFCVTRWGSEYIMLVDLLIHNREAVEYFARCEKEKVFIVLLQKWDELSDLMNVLKTPFDFTAYLQTPRISLSDMYGRWLKMEQVELKRFIRNDAGSQSKFAKMLSETLQNRKPMVMNTPLVLSAVYLDPRYRDLLSDNQLKIAKETLYKWHGRIYAIEHGESDDYIETTKDSFDEFVRKASKSQTADNLTTANGHLQPIQFALTLERYEKEHKQLNYKENIHDYWSKHQCESHLFKLARFIHTIPPTQVEIEKGFSVVGFILSPFRLALKSESLDDIIMIKLNDDLWNITNREVAANLFEPDGEKF